MAKLEQKAMLVALNIGNYSGRKFDRKVTAEIANQHGTLGRDIGNFNKLLLAKKDTIELDRIVNSARVFHRTNTLPWGVGYELLTISNFEKYSAGMREFSQSYDREVKRIQNKYPELIEEAKVRLKDMWNEDDYPTQDQLENKYYFKVTILPIPTTEDIRVNLQDEEIDEIKKSMEDNMKEVHAGIMKDLWGRLYEKIKNVSDQLSKDKTRIHTSLIGHLFDLCELLPSLNVLDDPNLNTLLRDVEADLCKYDTETLRDSEEARKEIAKNADAILARIPS